MDNPNSPITLQQIDRRFADLEGFAAESWSNIKLVERIRRLRLDVRTLRGSPADPLKPVEVDGKGAQ